MEAAQTVAAERKSPLTRQDQTATYQRRNRKDEWDDTIFEKKILRVSVPIYGTLVFQTLNRAFFYLFDIGFSLQRKPKPEGLQIAVIKLLWFLDVGVSAP